MNPAESEIPEVSSPIEVPIISSLYREKGKYWKNHFDETDKLWKPGQIDGLGEHRGIDFSCPIYTPVRACVSGKILVCGDDPNGFGLYVKQSYEGNCLYYGHLSRIDVKEGQYINTGGMIGLSGNTGRSTGPHLHLEARYGDGLSKQAFRINLL